MCDKEKSHFVQPMAHSDPSLCTVHIKPEYSSMYACCCYLCFISMTNKLFGIIAAFRRKKNLIEL